MDRHVDVAIVGAGTAGLFALRQVKQVTSNFVVIDGGRHVDAVAADVARAVGARLT